jgi:hypothetical protein
MCSFVKFTYSTLQFFFMAPNHCIACMRAVASCMDKSHLLVCARDDECGLLAGPTTEPNKQTAAFSLLIDECFGREC